MIQILSKWIAFKDSNIIDGFGDILHQFKEGDIIQINRIVISDTYPYYTSAGNIPLEANEILDNFILLGEYRNQRIDDILKD